MLRRLFSVMFTVAHTLVGPSLSLAQEAAQVAATTAQPEPLPGYNAMVARYAQAKWTYPDNDHMVELYPSKAAMDHIGTALVTVVCFIAETGKMSRCVPVSETPKGYGFGTATAELFFANTIVDPKTVTGGIQPGDLHIFKYSWNIIG